MGKKTKNANLNDDDYIEYVKMLELLEIAKKAELLDVPQYESVLEEIMKTYHVQSNFFLRRDSMDTSNNMGGRM